VWSWSRFRANGIGSSPSLCCIFDGEPDPLHLKRRYGEQGRIGAVRDRHCCTRTSERLNPKDCCDENRYGFFTAPELEDFNGRVVYLPAAGISAETCWPEFHFSRLGRFGS
jgi:hypothetical protein